MSRAQNSEQQDDQADLLDKGAPHLARTHQALLTSLCGSTSGLQSGAPWPMHRGCPSRAAQSSEYGPLEAAKNWSTNLNARVQSSAAVSADGSIFVGSNDGYLYKLDPAGTVLARANLQGAVRSSPAIGANGVVYVGSDLGALWALDAGTLEVRWRFATLGVLRSSPAVAPDGTIYVGSSDFRLYAVNPNGTKKWSVGTFFPIDSSPTIGADETIYVGSGDKVLRALNPNGTLKWQVGLGAGISSPPVLGRFGHIYAGAGDKLHAIDAATGAIVWQKSIGCTVTSPAVGANGVIYVGTNLCFPTGHALYAIAFDSTELWHFDVAGGIEGAPVIDRNGNLYFGANTGDILAVSPAGKQLWSYRTAHRKSSVDLARGCSVRR